MGSAGGPMSQRNLLEESSHICLLSGESVIHFREKYRMCCVLLPFLKTFTNLKVWMVVLTCCLCVQGRYVMAGCSEGALHVWNWETSTEICHIAAHKQRIHHCSLLPNTGEAAGKWVHVTGVEAISVYSLTIWQYTTNQSLYDISFNTCFVFKTRTKKSTQKKWLFWLRLMMAQCSYGNHYRSVKMNGEVGFKGVF